MIDTGCERSLDVINYRFSLLEAASYRINCGICYFTVSLKKVLYFEVLSIVITKGKLPVMCCNVL